MTDLDWRRSLAVFACLLGVLGCGAPGAGEKPIVDLMHCYARAADAIGEVRIHSANSDPAKAARDAGASIAGKCFREDALFDIWFPGREFDQQAAPDADSFPADVHLVGPDAWADWVSGIFRGSRYDFTQHLVGNIQVEQQGATAQLVASLIVSFFTLGPEPGVPSQCATVGMGTYTIDAERTGGEWRATRLRLTLMSVDPIFEGTPGGCQRPDASPSA